VTDSSTGVVNRVLRSVQVSKVGVLVAEKVSLEEVRKSLLDLVRGKLARGNGKDLVELLKGTLLSFRKQEEDHDEGNDVETGVEAERSGRGHRGQHSRERDGKDSGPEQTRRYSPSHAHLSVGKREDLGRVRERNGSLADRVERGKEEDEESNAPNPRRAGRLRNEERQTGSKQAPRHLRERRQHERPSAKRVDRDEGREGKQEVDRAKAERGIERLSGRVVGEDKDGGRVKGNDVDTAHLLRKHDDTRCDRRSSDSRDGPKLDESLDEAVSLDDLGFFLDLEVDVVEISSGLNVVVTEATERLESILCSTLLEEPSRRLRAEVDADDKRESGDESRTKLKTPSDRPNIHNDDVGAEAEEDTKCGPELPAHDKGSSNGCGRVLSSKDRNGSTFSSHTNTKEQTDNEQLLPSLGQARADGSNNENDGGDEDAASSTEPVVDGIRKPAPDEGTGDIRSGVDKTDDPLVCLSIRVASLDSDTKFGGERQVGSVRSSLIPTLRSGSDGTAEDGEVKSHRMRPFVFVFIVNGGSIVIVELLEDIVLGRSLSEDGTFPEDVDMFEKI